MRIEYVIPCRYAEVHDNTAFISGGGIDTTWVAELPTLMQAFFVVRLLVTPDEMGGAGGTHTLHAHIEGPSGERVGESLDVDVTPPAGAQYSHEWLSNLMLPLLLSWPAEQPGTYTVHVRVDTAEYPVPMHLTTGPPPGADAP